MQVMNALNSFDFRNLFLNGVCTYLKWSALHEHVDAVHESNSGCVKHNDCEEICADGVHKPRFVVSQINYKTRDYHSDRVKNVP
jgi:hypothetical protein